jgi:hypothetical protein
MEVSGYIQTLSGLIPGKEPRVPIEYESQWASEPVWTLWTSEKSLALTRNQTPIL